MTISYNHKDTSDENTDSHQYTVSLCNVDMRLRIAIGDSIKALVAQAEAAEKRGWEVDNLRARLNRLEQTTYQEQYKNGGVSI